MINYNDIIIINELGEGIHGITYLVKYNNNYYALKINKII